MSNSTDLIAYLRRRGQQCNRQQPIISVAGAELLKAADLLDEAARLREALEKVRALVYDGYEPIRDQAVAGQCVHGPLLDADCGACYDAALLTAIASADTHPEGGDGEATAPFKSGAVPKADAQTPDGERG
jgi:hypothetical protein